MIEPKFRITLKAKEPINGYKKNETVIIVNPIFDRNIGIAFYPIDKNFNIVSKEIFTGLQDKNKKDIFEKDGIKTKWSKHLEIDFYVKIIDGTFTLVDDYDNPSEFHHLFDNVDFEYEVS